MKEDSFIDTNILVYAYDSEAGWKHNLAMDLVDSLWISGDNGNARVLVQGHQHSCGYGRLP